MDRHRRIAVAGKGGAGKTTFAATVARLVARTGRSTLVIDGDSNPNVAVALGVPREDAARAPGLPHELVSRRLDGGPKLAAPVEEVLRHHALRGPDGVDVIVMGGPHHAEEGCLCSAHAVVGAVLADAGSEGSRVVVVDMEASPEHFARGTTRSAELIWLVVEPYFRSLETARRMAALAAELPVARVAVVANKVRSDDDVDAIAEFCARDGLPVDAWLPWSDGVVAADRAAVPVVDHDPAGPYVAAVAEAVRAVLI